MVDAIIIAGARVLASKGWSGFTTNAVAARAGVSIGSLYEYFRNKQGLVDAIAISHISNGERLLVQAYALAEVPRTNAELVGMLVEGAIALHADDPQLHRVLSSEAPLSAQVRQRAERLRLDLVAVVTRSLGGRQDNPRLAAQLLVDVTDAIIHRWWIDDDGRFGNPQQLSSELKAMLEAYLNRAG